MLCRQGMGFRKCPGLGCATKWSNWSLYLRQDDVHTMW